jgi:nickel-type superoxide dismutase maturation protease
MSIFGFKIWRVDDHSMSPAIPKASYVLVNHWFNWNRLNVENIVLIHHHFYGKIIKKIAVIDHHGFIWSKGDNVNSVPIEQVGPINKSQIIGHVLWIFKPS